MGHDLTGDPAASTPVLVGAGEHAERVGDPAYQTLSPVDLAARAARRALADSGADSQALAGVIDTVAGIRQFELSGLAPPNPFGRPENFPYAVAARVGVTPRRTVLEIGGGQGPQHLVGEFAAAIRAGQARGVLLVGSEALSTIRHLREHPEAGCPDWHEPGTADGHEDRGPGLDDMLDPSYAAHGLVGAIPAYALFENARRLALGESRDRYAAAMGELFAPFTRIAAANPYAVAPTERTAGELVTPDERNRMLADPYTRFLVARDQVNQGAAVILTSVGEARRLGIPDSRLVYLHGHADAVERDLLDRPDLARSPASIEAIRSALDQAGIGIPQVRHLDLYSCFPIAVFNVTDAFGLGADDPRGLTVTGGLPFFGGAGNNYAMHGIVGIVRAVRADPGGYGMATANGGIMSKYSVGVYSTVPREFAGVGSVLGGRGSSGAPGRRYAGRVVVDTCTVVFEAGMPVRGIVVGVLPSGDRLLATTQDGATIGALLGEHPRGLAMDVATVDGRNVASICAQPVQTATIGAPNPTTV